MVSSCLEERLTGPKNRWGWPSVVHLAPTWRQPHRRRSGGTVAGASGSVERGVVFSRDGGHSSRLRGTIRSSLPMRSCVAFSCTAVDQLGVVTLGFGDSSNTLGRGHVVRLSCMIKACRTWVCLDGVRRCTKLAQQGWDAAGRSAALRVVSFFFGRGRLCVSVCLPACLCGCSFVYMCMYALFPQLCCRCRGCRGDVSACAHSTMHEKEEQPNPSGNAGSDFRVVKPVTGSEPQTNLAGISNAVPLHGKCGQLFLPT